jgi:hypothetical protein
MEASRVKATGRRDTDLHGLVDGIYRRHHRDDLLLGADHLCYCEFTDVFQRLELHLVYRFKTFLEVGLDLRGPTLTKLPQLSLTSHIDGVAATASVRAASRHRRDRVRSDPPRRPRTAPNSDQRPATISSPGDDARRRREGAAAPRDAEPRTRMTSLLSDKILRRSSFERK